MNSPGVAQFIVTPPETTNVLDLGLQCQPRVELFPEDMTHLKSYLKVVFFCHLVASTTPGFNGTLFVMKSSWKDVFP